MDSRKAAWRIEPHLMNHKQAASRRCARQGGQETNDKFQTKKTDKWESGWRLTLRLSPFFFPTPLLHFSCDCPLPLCSQTKNTLSTNRLRTESRECASHPPRIGSLRPPGTPYAFFSCFCLPTCGYILLFAIKILSFIDAIATLYRQLLECRLLPTKSLEKGLEFNSLFTRFNDS